jgi:hypothetical protein
LRVFQCQRMNTPIEPPRRTRGSSCTSRRRAAP